MEYLVVMGLFLNPILAIVFCLNLISIIKKANGDEKISTQKNTVWATISFVYIITSLTWSFAFIPFA
uniref:PCZ2.2 n=1 Tax=Planococcus sp. ZOYM TaxID=378212 RepID=Q1PHH5_9BACL|nr:PCZ2.2 [Planococcus sp. ZOYM]